jgi:hypothetical protein
MAWPWPLRLSVLPWSGEGRGAARFPGGEDVGEHAGRLKVSGCGCMVHGDLDGWRMSSVPSPGHRPALACDHQAALVCAPSITGGWVVVTGIRRPLDRFISARWPGRK